MATQTSQQSWHPVTPKIDDPDLALPPAPAATRWDGGAAPPPDAGGAWPCLPAPSKGFFAEHRFAVVVSVVVLLILIVLLYVYLTRRGGEKGPKKGVPDPRKKGGGAPGTEPPPLPGGHVDVDLDELDRLRAARRQVRMAPPPPGGPHPATPHQTTPQQPAMAAPAPAPAPRPPAPLSVPGVPPPEPPPVPPRPPVHGRAPQPEAPPVVWPPAQHGTPYGPPPEASPEGVPHWSSARPSACPSEPGRAAGEGPSTAAAGGRAPPDELDDFIGALRDETEAMDHQERLAADGYGEEE